MTFFDESIFVPLQKYFPSKTDARMRGYFMFKARFISRSSLGNATFLGEEKPDLFGAFADWVPYWAIQSLVKA